MKETLKNQDSLPLSFESFSDAVKNDYWYNEHRGSVIYVVSREGPICYVYIVNGDLIELKANQGKIEVKTTDSRGKTIAYLY